MTPRLLAAAAIVLALNLPFGFWRAGARRFSRPWMLAVHAPVPLVVVVRLAAGLGWHLVTFPVLITAFFTGQFVGGRFRRRRLAGDGPATAEPADSPLPPRTV